MATGVFILAEVLDLKKMVCKSLKVVSIEMSHYNSLLEKECFGVKLMRN